MPKWQSKFAKNNNLDRKSFDNATTANDGPQSLIDSDVLLSHLEIDNNSTTATTNRQPNSAVEAVVELSRVVKNDIRQPKPLIYKDLEAVVGLSKDFPYRFIKDERVSCWWCEYWHRSGYCINSKIGKVYAVASGVLHRCSGFRARLTPIPENMGFCVRCGSWLHTQMQGVWIKDPNNDKLLLLVCQDCQHAKRYREDFVNKN